MTVYKLTDDFFDDPYTLIAIHSSLDSYRLAYFLNGLLDIKLKRLKRDLVLYQEAAFPVYEAFDVSSDLQWNLLANKSTVRQESQAEMTGMFGAPTGEKVVYVLPEHAKVDYLLKIDDGEGGLKEAVDILKKIKELPQVITAYELDADQLKSKNNLIFLANA